MNREEFFNKNLLRELVYFVIVTILVSFNIGWICIPLNYYLIVSSSFFAKFHKQVSTSLSQ